MKPQDKIFVVIGSVAILGAAAAGGLALFAGGSDSAASTSTPTTSQTQSSGNSSTDSSSSTGTSSSSSSSSSSYKDGTYTATAYYMVPHGGSNSIETKLTVSGGKITSVSTTNSASENESEMYISSFKQYLSSDVVGQSLSGFYGSRIGGASLTTDGFNQTLDTIRSDAAA